VRFLPYSPRRRAALRKVALRVADARRFARHVGHRLGEENVTGVAGALSYTSLLALVPLLAIALSVLAAFPVFDDARAQLQAFVLDNFLPAAGDAVAERLTDFIAAAGRLTAVGVVGLAVTAVLLLTTIETAFNRIFEVRQGRRVLARLVVYWTVLTLGPLLIGASFAIAGQLANVALGTRAGGVWAHVSLAVPYLLTLAAFTLLYALLPNRPVRLTDAAVGAMVAAVLFAALRFGFVVFVTHVTTYQTLYGALAALPIFLIWMFLSWMVVLAGAVMAAALPEWRRRRGLPGGDARQARLILALDVLGAVDRSAPHGLDRAEMLAATAAAESALRAVVERLRSGRFVARTTEDRWVLVRPLAQATIFDLVLCLDLAVPDLPADSAGRPWHGPLSECLAAARAGEAEALRPPLAGLIGGGAASD
jgi:membrane protein